MIDHLVQNSTDYSIQTSRWMNSNLKFHKATSFLPVHALQQLLFTTFAFLWRPMRNVCWPSHNFLGRGSGFSKPSFLSVNLFAINYTWLLRHNSDFFNSYYSTLLSQLCPWKLWIPPTKSWLKAWCMIHFCNVIMQCMWLLVTVNYGWP